jgi:hypothetical protein
MQATKTRRQIDLSSYGKYYTPEFKEQAVKMMVGLDL